MGYPGYVDDTHTPIPGKVDANGKPLVKKGQDIPLFGRTVAVAVDVAEVYDALSSRRLYKEAWDNGRVNKVMRESSGTHFDPELIDIFFERIKIMHAIRQRYKEEVCKT